MPASLPAASTPAPSPFPPPSNADSRQFRNALGMFATGVAVITVRAPDGRALGLTVNSFNSVSLEPPLIVWSLGNDFVHRKVFEDCEHYAINILSAEQQGLSNLFASRNEDKFSGLLIEEGLGGAPLLPDCCAWFECRNTTRYAGGDHLLFLSEVVRFRYQERAPLLFHAGNYRCLAP